MKKQSLNVGVIGLGRVGTEVATQLHALGGRADCPLKLTHLWGETVPKYIPQDQVSFSKSWEELVKNPNIDVVVEAMSGGGHAYEAVQTALDHGKHVVTANSVLMAGHAEQLFKNARAKGVQLRCEAAVMGPVPCLHTITVGLSGSDITRLVGQLNSPTNAMLERMSLLGETFDQAQRATQELNQASRHSELDVAGKDTLYKLALLSYAAFGRSIPLKRQQPEGIENINPLDLRLAGQLGYVVKLLGVATPQKIMVRPMLVADDEPLALSPGSQTALHILSSAGPMTLMGEGGGLPIVSAGLVAEVLAIARGRSPLPLGERKPPNTSEHVPLRRYYVRLPAGQSVKENGLTVADQVFDPDARVNALLLEGRVSVKEVASHIGRSDAVIYEVLDV
jgi:homoserine dehydrogenase